MSRIIHVPHPDLQMHTDTHPIHTRVYIFKCAPSFEDNGRQHLTENTDSLEGNLCVHSGVQLFVKRDSVQRLRGSNKSALCPGGGGVCFITRHPYLISILFKGLSSILRVQSTVCWLDMPSEIKLLVCHTSHILAIGYSNQCITIKNGNVRNGDIFLRPTL